MNQQLARDLLAEIEETQQRSEQYLGYWRRGPIVQLWGVVWIVAHLACYWLPSKAGSIWMICDVAGFIGTMVLRWRERDGDNQQQNDRRLAWAGCILLAFGIIVSMLIGPRGRGIEMFWTCLAMSAYMLHGLWFGLRWTVLGGLVIAVSLAAYLLQSPWYDLIMAVAAGGGLLLGGTWMRHAR